MIYWTDAKGKDVRIVDKDTHWVAITRNGVEHTVYWLATETREAQQWLKKHATDPLTNTLR